MDDAIAIIETAAAAVAKPASHAATPGDAAKPITTGQPGRSGLVPAPLAKTTKAIRAGHIAHIQ